MQLTTERLILSEVTEQDFPEIHAMNSYPEVMEFNTAGIPENLSVTENLYRHMLEDQKN